MYVDSSEVKQLRLKYVSLLPLQSARSSVGFSRHGQLEDRDPYRLKDRTGIPVICFRCGKTALPSSADASPSAMYCRRSTSTIHSTTPEAWRSMLSCDYCNLHWHLDCLEPPLTSMPSYGKKWMCPNHTDQVLVSTCQLLQRIVNDLLVPSSSNPSGVSRSKTLRLLIL